MDTSETLKRKQRNSTDAEDNYSSYNEDEEKTKEVSVPPFSP